MSTKTDALQEISEIMLRHKLKLEEITNYLSSSDAGNAKKESVLSSILGYIGGILVFAGIGVYIAMFWEEMNNASRITVSLGSGFITYLLALVTLTDVKFHKAITPLLLMSSLLQPVGILVTLEAYSTGGDESHALLFMCFIMLLQQSLTFYKYRQSVLIFTMLVFGSIFYTVLADLFNFDDNFIAISAGVSLLAICFGIDKTPHNNITPLWYFIGSISLLCGSFDILEGSVFEILYLGLSCFLVYVSTVIKSRVLLFVSTISILFYIGYFTGEHFANSVGWPVTLIFMGVILIGLSKFALKINRQYIQDNQR